MLSLTQLEANRMTLQVKLDCKKSKSERNLLGQFATPPQLAKEILEQGKALIPQKQPVRFLDPAFGTGAFYTAFLDSFSSDRIELARGYEIDEHYGEPTRRLWTDHALDLILEDFTKAIAPRSDNNKFNLIVCNPPYVRHHHIPKSEKLRLQNQASEIAKVQVSGLAGLYIHFFLIAHRWLQNNGIAGWLIPSEFMDVKYGEALRHFLTNEVMLLHIHRFSPDSVQFDDALVSSVIVWYRKRRPRLDDVTLMSYGAHLMKPILKEHVAISQLRQSSKWSHILEKNYTFNRQSNVTLIDLFDIKRGVATGANSFFILKETQIDDFSLPRKFLTPILPNPRYLESNEILAELDGTPKLKEKYFLLDCNLPERQIQEHYPALWEYLLWGRSQGIHERYLCRQRSLWYMQDKRQPSPFLCTYMGRKTNTRNNPFRFILNHSRAIAPNVYLNIYPRSPLAILLVEQPNLKLQIWKSLNEISVERLLSEGRVYGGGLYKLEPRELGNLSIEHIFPDEAMLLEQIPQQIPLF